MKTDNSVIWLVAEDSEDDYFLLKRACTRVSPSPKLQRARNGAEAQQYLQGEGLFQDREIYPLPAMVVSDLKMPSMDGLELLAWFKHQRWEPAIRFILLTSSDAQCDRGRAQERGVDEYLLKPGKFTDLIATVAGISERNLHWTQPPLPHPVDQRAENGRALQALAMSGLGGLPTGLPFVSARHELASTLCPHQGSALRGFDHAGSDNSRP